MILRRIGEHAKTQNWFAVMLDFFIEVHAVHAKKLIGDIEQHLKDSG